MGNNETFNDEFFGEISWWEAKIKIRENHVFLYIQNKDIKNSIEVIKKEVFIFKENELKIREQMMLGLTVVGMMKKCGGLNLE
jgi:hypothetical protein